MVTWDQQIEKEITMSNEVVEVYEHPLGARIEVYADDTVKAWNAEGKRKKTTATAARLRAGHGQWTLVVEEEVTDGDEGDDPAEG